jgi:hypothetical protein
MMEEGERRDGRRRKEGWRRAKGRMEEGERKDGGGRKKGWRRENERKDGGGLGVVLLRN